MILKKIKRSIVQSAILWEVMKSYKILENAVISIQRDKDYCELQYMERTPEFTRGVLFICCNSLEDKK